MGKSKSITQFLYLMAVAIGISSSSLNQAFAATPANGSLFKGFEGTYNEINTDNKGEILSLNLRDNQVNLMGQGLFDVAFGYNSKPTDVTVLDNGISINCVFHNMVGVDDVKEVPATITLRKNASGVYDLDIDLGGQQPYDMAGVKKSTPMFKLDDYRIDGAVPAKLGEKVYISGLIKAVGPYVFTPDMLSTRLYLKNHSNLSDGESVRQDEKNRFLEYAWGEEGRMMECKYWYTDDGGVLLVMNAHDSNYEYPQTLRFFKFDRNNNTVREVIRPLGDEWPYEPFEENNGIVYQVRYNSDGLVALVPEKNGDSFNIVTLKFDGRIFK